MEKALAKGKMSGLTLRDFDQDEPNLVHRSTHHAGPNSIAIISKTFVSFVSTESGLCYTCGYRNRPPNWINCYFGRPIFQAILWPQVRAFAETQTWAYLSGLSWRELTIEHYQGFDQSYRGHSQRRDDLGGRRTLHHSLLPSAGIQSQNPRFQARKSSQVHR